MIDSIKGKYGPEDNIYYVNKHPIKLKELVKIIIEIRDNENKRYGRGWLNKHGDLLFRRILNKIINGATYEELEHYTVPGFNFDSSDV
jgi:hypothetical protein